MAKPKKQKHCESSSQMKPGHLNPGQPPPPNVLLLYDYYYYYYYYYYYVSNAFTSKLIARGCPSQLAAVCVYASMTPSHHLAVDSS